LVTLSADELNVRVAQARAALDLANREYARETDLLRQGATAQETVNRLADNRRIADANLDQVAAQLAYTQVVAPFAGVITARHVEPGDLASPGLPLFAIEGRGAFEVEVAVPDSLPLVPLGDELTVIHRENRLMAHVREASPAADPASRTRLVVLALPRSSDVRSGQYVRVHWPVAQRNQLKVPSTAITRFGQMDRVFVESDGRATLRLVRIGARQDDRTVVLAGLNAGERVVLNPPTGLRDGQSLILDQ
jgi:RND family efflux transporter MFP subunit